MFYKIGFYILLAIVIAAGWMFVRSNPMKNEGAASWIEIYSSVPTETIKFLADNFGIHHEKSKDAMDGMEYTLLKADGQFWPFGGIMGLPKMENGKTAPPHTMIYLTVNDYAAAHKKMVAGGAEVILADRVAGGMKFGIYVIPGGIEIGLAQYGVKK